MGKSDQFGRPEAGWPNQHQAADPKPDGRINSKRPTRSRMAESTSDDPKPHRAVAEAKRPTTTEGKRPNQHQAADPKPDGRTQAEVKRPRTNGRVQTAEGKRPNQHQAVAEAERPARQQATAEPRPRLDSREQTPESRRPKPMPGNNPHAVVHASGYQNRPAERHDGHYSTTPITPLLTPTVGGEGLQKGNKNLRVGGLSFWPLLHSLSVAQPSLH